MFSFTKLNLMSVALRLARSAAGTFNLQAQIQTTVPEVAIGPSHAAHGDPHQPDVVRDRYSLDNDGRTEYHLRSQRPTLHQTFEEFGLKNNDLHENAIDPTPWKPFRTRGDHCFTKIALDAGLNKAQVEGLLTLISLVSQGKESMTLKNEAELRRTCDNAEAELTPFSKHVVSVQYKKEPVECDVHTRPIWEWALDLLANPKLGPHFVWDAERSQLPADVENTVPFVFILYVDKTKLSSHGTVKGYPVVVQCANLPVDIRNSQSIGGGCVVGWLPIMSYLVPEDVAEEGKLGYTTLKRVVWHEAFVKLLEAVIQYSKSGYSHKCWDEITRWLFPLILILSADYEEQCMMSLIRGRNGKCPCTVCLVPLEELHDLAKTFPLRNSQQGEDALKTYRVKKSIGEELLKKLGLRPVDNIFWLIMYSDPHKALSFNCLHFLHLGIWGKHLYGELKIILGCLGRNAEATVEGYAKDFLHWRKFAHFKTILQVTYSDGNKLADLSIQLFYSTLNVLTPAASPEGYLLLELISSYLQLDSLIGLDVHMESTLTNIEVELLIFNRRLKAYLDAAEKSAIPNLKVNWDFPKTHLWKHKMHSPLKEAYQDRSNGRDVAGQILQVDQHVLACKLLRSRIDLFDKWTQSRNGEDSDDSDSDQEPTLHQLSGHFRLGSPRKPETILELETNHSMKDRAFVGFRKKFTDFINEFLPSCGHELTRWLFILTHFKMCEYCYLKVHYESLVDWRKATDYIRCNPLFHRHPCYDCALIQLTPTQTAFIRLILMFTCEITGFGVLQLALVQPYTAGIGAQRQLDRQLKLTRVRAVPRGSSIFIPVDSIIRGALLYPDPAHKDDFLVIDHVDGNMFLRMKTWER
ncbi:hypothetical protein PAXINDRAFT_164124 [Paxillus involutus ATCC 200175]|uniref:Uncharacterized protein n=1 Tax=Paxillus involutus ATCC 200175 TaxID=664439 RepID=A0A0C9SSJ2_PAXIN|nr:hypothetical protein PAXINDRAFT_164124 [Paxillus involutus ATCC 200175]